MDCNTSHFDLKHHLTAMLRKSGALVGLPIIEVSGHTSAAFNCDNAHFTFEDFVRASIGVDSCGKPALRVKIIDTCDVLVNCSNNVDANPLSQMFAYDATEKTYAVVLNRAS
jgi:hypothetical protein